MNLLVFSILTVVCLNEISATLLDVEACHEIGKASKAQHILQKSSYFRFIFPDPDIWACI